MGAHAHRAIRDTSLQSSLAPCVNVLAGKVAFGGRGFPYRLGDRALFDPAAVENAGLVEMDVRLDHAGDHETARGIQFATVSMQSRGYRRNRRAANADVDDAKLAPLQRAGVTNDEIH